MKFDETFQVGKARLLVLQRILQQFNSRRDLRVETDLQFVFLLEIVARQTFARSNKYFDEFVRETSRFESRSD